MAVTGSEKILMVYQGVQSLCSIGQCLTIMVKEKKIEWHGHFQYSGPLFTGNRIQHTSHNPAAVHFNVLKAVYTYVHVTAILENIKALHRIMEQHN